VEESAHDIKVQLVSAAVQAELQCLHVHRVSPLRRRASKPVPNSPCRCEHQGRVNHARVRARTDQSRMDGEMTTRRAGAGFFEGDPGDIFLLYSSEL